MNLMRTICNIGQLAYDKPSRFQSAYKRIYRMSFSLCVLVYIMYNTQNTLGTFYGSHLVILVNVGEEHVPEELWGGGNIVPSWRRGQEELLL